MKKKLLVLTLGALCVSQILENNHASAVVSGEKNPYVSKALSVKGQKSNSWNLDQYKDSLNKLITSIDIHDYDGYDELEYKDINEKYQKKFLAEIDALNKFIDEERKIAYYSKNNIQIPVDILGLTHERYLKIYESLQENKKEFEIESKKIEEKYPELKRYSNDEEYESNVKLNELENKVLMLGYAFFSNKGARENLYNKLDIVVGLSTKEREDKTPKNKRMSDDRVKDLESIIDEFFVEISENRPADIPVLVENNEENIVRALKLKADTEEAKTNVSKRSKRSLDSQNYKSTSSKVSEEQKANYEKKFKEIKERFLAKQQNKNTPVVSLEYDEDDDVNDKKLVVSEPTKNPTLPTYTETTTQVPMPTVERQTQQQITYQAPKQLAGLNGESHDFTTTHQSPTNSNHTHNNLVEFEETSALPGRKTGSLVGISQIDSSHLTEREKRVIKREHVREAQKLVENYKDTHSYKDRLNAQQKVNTLSEGHQKRFNKQINKVYNGK
ncbi:coagulase [Staphylococcus schweitzeri]|uniref:Coagulase n=1 Tax=Staphylococcus schweitzeri TaxID=1654388 RepID=A0A2K4AIL9_9STAP|nr:von Willebrand factor binding protein Vwb [Staphylococcus schweitzeri]MBE2129978.1 von Willebrand factor binding protein Vwb [Staphylococcus schweitzeri]PNZ49857.1 coagulase [Staphylococcus schweitzeri]CDR55211.1 secreted von Willebrand factor-binding protein precursor [Staphylococcus schweitzeri]VEE65419.1 Staphylocoagulase precursor [Staphylococcus schweitzeri]